MQGFKNRDFIPLARQIPGAGQSRRSGPDHRHLVSVGCRLFCRLRCMGIVPVRHKTFQSADADRVSAHAAYALAFALALLRADAPAHGRKRAVAVDDLVGLLKTSGCKLADKYRNLDMHRAAFDAEGILAVQASSGFFHSCFFVVAHGHLEEIFISDIRFLRRHGMLFF